MTYNHIAILNMDFGGAVTVLMPKNNVKAKE